MSDLLTLVEAEYAFARAATQKGIRDSFLAFLADDSILFRPGPVPGKKWMSEQPQRPGLLTWEPIFADIAQAGDLGYTTGPWEFRAGGPDEEPAGYGYYISLWQKQVDGAWKVLIDTGIFHPPPGTPLTGWRPSPQEGQVAQTVTEFHGNLEQERETLLATDRELSSISVQKSIAQALLSYIADDARVFRTGMHPLVGKEAVETALSRQTEVMTWEPAGAGVSGSGDMGYTYGLADLRTGGPEGDQVMPHNYLRIWRKQPGGSWQVVLDVATPFPPGATSS